MDASAKQQVVEKLKSAVNVLICVSRDPSVDQLSAAIGFGLLLNKLDKHATPVFSGKTPSTIEFLSPSEQLHKNTDSLQDFIISLDKSKADKLRYKVEDNVVKIFITPYKASLTSADLDFSQGDFNVDAVVCLGVDEREHLDEAIISHGRILHDATVMTVMAGKQPSNLGSINWQDSTSSSLCEMLVSISESFQSGLLDEQISTAFLTGIVSETERFRNDKTTPKVMTMAAQLMAAGANQQLIADSLLKPEPEPEPKEEPFSAELEADEHKSMEEIVETAKEPESIPLPQPEEVAESEPEAAPAPELEQIPNTVDEPAPEEEVSLSEPIQVAKPLPPSPKETASHETAPPELTLEDLNKASIEYKSNNPDLAAEQEAERVAKLDEIRINHEGDLMTAEEASIKNSLPSEPMPEVESTSGHTMMESRQPQAPHEDEDIPEDKGYVIDKKKKLVLQPVDYNPDAPKTDLSDPAAVASSLGDEDSLERLSPQEAREQVEQAIAFDPDPMPHAEESINSLPMPGQDDPGAPPDGPPPPIPPPSV